MRKSNYDKFPAIALPAGRVCRVGWTAIGDLFRETARPISRVLVECYPGVDAGLVLAQLERVWNPSLAIATGGLFKSPAEIDALVAPFLGGDDPVFGRLCFGLEMADFLDPVKKSEAEFRMARAPGLVLVVGPGAFEFAGPADLLIHADMPRWEGQLRQRRGQADNLGVSNRGLKPSLQYKRSFFIDWRIADRLKQRTMARWDYLLDTTGVEPKLISGQTHLEALKLATTRPFRVVPFFDPGPWGGQWMRRVCDLPDGPPNYAWCFDCVPEENSLLLEFHDGTRVEIPAINLVFNQAASLLGEPVFGRFGAEFPIRFDFLDTMGGGNLSFQVHPTADHAFAHFGLRYTQDESYYLLEAEPDACVYLGRKPDTKLEEMIADLEAAQNGGKSFDDDKFAARFPARKHDHFLIPAGTLHCSGAGAMVLEISATPYIFTFKLWDWGRLGLDGLPRPVNIRRGREVIDWGRDENYARERLVNRVCPVADGEGWREESTGLHEAEFIETRRHWFTGPVEHDTGGRENGGVHVLNLVQGAEAIVESPHGAFAPFIVHYAETFIVPAAVGRYRIRPHGAGEREAAAGVELATLKAFVRTRA